MRRGVVFCLLICLLLSSVLPAAAQDAASSHSDFSDFSDLSDIVNRSEVRLLVALGMISGYEDGSFRPQGTLTRAQTAKLLALLCTDEPEGSLNGRFSDVSGGWAAPYIAYCADRGILSGYGGRFRPDDQVTGRELAKMLLVATGSDPARYTGAGWAEAVDADAAEAGLFLGYDADPALPIDRDFACLLICSAMQRPAMEDGERITDDLLNPLTYLEHRFGAIRCSGVVVANEHADLSDPGKTAAPGVTRLAGYKDFNLSTDLSMVGKYVDLYVRDGQVLGEPCVSRTACKVFDSKAALDRLLRDSEYALAYDAAYYYNYTPSNRQTLNQLPDGAEIVAVDADGDLRFEQLLMTVYTDGRLQQDGRRVLLTTGETVACVPMTAGAPMGRNVRCVQVCGVWYVK